eukprot:TRINITY_DN22769_c0_g1_i2.p1 TRINITY_DN22769_c0_g1~~TRINITY_DN22769_c0_g1_i2.p1  ORF type:complete len:159 (+),score=29.08 TRINITY_DN22769_c0_g1_i2:34-510(+)
MRAQCLLTADPVPVRMHPVSLFQDMNEDLRQLLAASKGDAAGRSREAAASDLADLTSAQKVLSSLKRRESDDFLASPGAGARSSRRGMDSHQEETSGALPPQRGRRKVSRGKCGFFPAVGASQLVYRCCGSDGCHDETPPMRFSSPTDKDARIRWAWA